VTIAKKLCFGILALTNQGTIQRFLPFHAVFYKFAHRFCPSAKLVIPIAAIAGMPRKIEGCPGEFLFLC